MKLKVAYYTAKGTANEAARWGYWARRAGLKSVGAWLERLARREVLRQEIACGARDPPDADSLNVW